MIELAYAPMCRAMVWLATLMTIGAVPACLLCQQPPSDDDLSQRVTLPSPVVFRVNNDSTFALFNEQALKSLVSAVFRPPRFDEIILLNKRWIQAELELTDSQRRHFQGAHDDLYLKPHYLKQVPDDLTEILDQKQENRFRQLVIRCRIRALGLSRFFNEDALGLTLNEVKAIKDLLARIEPDYDEKIKEMRDKSIESLLAQLTDEQRQKFSETSAGFLEMHPPPMPLLYWQLTNIDRFEEVIVDRNFPELRGLFISHLLLHFDVDGNIEEEPSGSYNLSKMTDVEKKRLEETAPNGLWAGLFGLLLSDTGIAELQMTEEQRDRFMGIHSDMWALQTVWDELPKTITDRRDLEKAYDELRIRNFEICATINRQLLNEILLPHQRELLNSFSMVLEVVRGGHVSAFVHGHLGRHLQITERQQQELRTEAKKIAQENNSQMAAWEEEILKQIKATLSQESRNRLADIFCDPPPQGPPNLGWMLKDDKSQ